MIIAMLIFSFYNSIYLSSKNGTAEFHLYVVYPKSLAEKIYNKDNKISYDYKHTFLSNKTYFK